VLVKYLFYSRHIKKYNLNNNNKIDSQALNYIICCSYFKIVLKILSTYIVAKLVEVAVVVEKDKINKDMKPYIIIIKLDEYFI